MRYAISAAVRRVEATGKTGFNRTASRCRHGVSRQRSGEERLPLRQERSPGECPGGRRTGARYCSMSYSWPVRDYANGVRG